VHAHFSIDADRVWDTLHDDLPPLIIELERAASWADETWLPPRARR
jgi:uncharacterized protein with HEPN domain